MKGQSHKAWLDPLSYNRCPVPGLLCGLLLWFKVVRESGGRKAQFCGKQWNVGPTAHLAAHRGLHYPAGAGTLHTQPFP